MESVDFTHLELPSSPNTYLVCPENICQNAKPHATSPTYQISVDELTQAWQIMVSQQPRVEVLKQDDPNQWNYIQRTLILRFPDYITVRFYDRGSQTSTLAIYSRSKYGYSDWGVNKQRVNDWLESLQRVIDKQAIK